MAKASEKRTAKGKPVIVRTYSAGVHFGYLAKREGREVHLTGSRRIWYWKGANTLSEIALRGVSTGSKIAERVNIVLTEAIEVIDCTKEAVSNLETSEWQK
jgi:hypothetical protein